MPISTNFKRRRKGWDNYVQDVGNNSKKLYNASFVLFAIARDAASERESFQASQDPNNSSFAVNSVI